MVLSRLFLLEVVIVMFFIKYSFNFLFRREVKGFEESGGYIGLLERRERLLLGGKKRFIKKIVNVKNGN